VLILVGKLIGKNNVRFERKNHIDHVWDRLAWRVFSRDELKQEEIRLRLGNSAINFYIGDVRDRDSVDYVMAGVDYIFHAAALR
jgi:FlaA1/EpsC-like NDP-sugar epimerase